MVNGIQHAIGFWTKHPQFINLKGDILLYANTPVCCDCLLAIWLDVYSAASV